LSKAGDQSERFLDQAVVDGRLLKNVPANALVAKCCNFVIASTETAKLEKVFMGLRSEKSPSSGRFVTSVQVIMRQNMIQSHSMNAVGVEPAEFVIAPTLPDRGSGLTKPRSSVGGQKSLHGVRPVDTMLDG
jgi:hypothetical protein